MLLDTRNHVFMIDQLATLSLCQPLLYFTDKPSVMIQKAIDRLLQSVSRGSASPGSELLEQGFFSGVRCNSMDVNVTKL